MDKIAMYKEWIYTGDMEKEASATTRYLRGIVKSMKNAKTEGEALKHLKHFEGAQSKLSGGVSPDLAARALKGEKDIKKRFKPSITASRYREALGRDRYSPATKSELLPQGGQLRNAIEQRKARMARIKDLTK